MKKYLDNEVLIIEYQAIDWIENYDKAVHGSLDYLDPSILNSEEEFHILYEGEISVNSIHKEFADKHGLYTGIEKIAISEAVKIFQFSQAWYDNEVSKYFQLHRQDISKNMIDHPYPDKGLRGHLKHYEDLITGKSVLNKSRFSRSDLNGLILGGKVNKSLVYWFDDLFNRNNLKAVKFNIKREMIDSAEIHEIVVAGVCQKLIEYLKNELIELQEKTTNQGDSTNLPKSTYSWPKDEPKLIESLKTIIKHKEDKPKAFTTAFIYQAVNVHYGPNDRELFKKYLLEEHGIDCKSHNYSGVAKKHKDYWEKQGYPLS